MHMWMKIAGLLVGIAVGIGGAGAAFAQNVTLADIKSRGTVTVGTEAASFPFEFVENGKIVGYNKDILDRVVASWHVSLTSLTCLLLGSYRGLIKANTILLRAISSSIRKELPAMLSHFRRPPFIWQWPNEKVTVVPSLLTI